MSHCLHRWRNSCARAVCERPEDARGRCALTVIVMTVDRREDGLVYWSALTRLVKMVTGVGQLSEDGTCERRPRAACGLSCRAAEIVIEGHPQG